MRQNNLPKKNPICSSIRLLSNSLVSKFFKQSLCNLSVYRCFQKQKYLQRSHCNLFDGNIFWHCNSWCNQVSCGKWIKSEKLPKSYWLEMLIRKWNIDYPTFNQAQMIKLHFCCQTHVQAAIFIIMHHASTNSTIIYGAFKTTQMHIDSPNLCFPYFYHFLQCSYGYHSNISSKICTIKLSYILIWSWLDQNGQLGCTALLRLFEQSGRKKRWSLTSLIASFEITL